MVDLSIIIVSWNTKKLLLSCVRSVFEDLRGISGEVIVVDNGSQDGSGNEVKNAFPLINLVENERNLGFAKAVNQGLQKASGKYLLLVNPDTEVKNGAIKQLLLPYPKRGKTG